MRFFGKKEDAHTIKNPVRGQCLTCGTVSNLKYCKADGKEVNQSFEPTGHDLLAYRRPGPTAPKQCNACHVFSPADAKFCEYCATEFK